MMPPPSMGNDPMMGGGDPNPMGGDTPDMGGEEMSPMSDDTDMGDDDEITSLFNSLSDENKKAAKKYIESMVDDDNHNGVDDGSEFDNQEMKGGEMPQPPMGESFVREFNNVAMQPRNRVRDNREVSTKKPLKNNPFISNRG